MNFNRSETCVLLATSAKDEHFSISEWQGENRGENNNKFVVFFNTFLAKKKMKRKQNQQCK